MTDMTRRDFFRKSGTSLAIGGAALALAGASTSQAHASDNKAEKACALCPGNNISDTHKVKCDDCGHRMWLCEAHERGTHCPSCEVLRALGVTPPSEVETPRHMLPRRGMVS